MFKNVRELPDLLLGVHPHPFFTIDLAGQPQVIGVCDLVDRDDFGSEWTKPGNVLGGPEPRAGRDFSLLQIAARQVI